MAMPDMYLEQLYWAHIEHFPMHFGGLPVKVVDDLLCVLSHALTGIIALALLSSCIDRVTIC